MRGFRLLATLIAFCLAASRLHAQIPSFPGAVGFGAADPGAAYLSGTTHYGGNVYHVTNLNDSGPGSFRTGVGGGGNIVVFDVGGSIQSLSPVACSSNIDIEGQTAPGGIQIFGAETSFYGRSNIICRFMHFRDGTLDPNYPGSSATNSHTNAVNLGDTNNIIMDHCTFEFAAYNNVDEAGSSDITFQNCIFADPISEQRFNCHFEGGPVTFINCLWANAHGRSPLGKANLQFVNNIVYNYGYGMDTGNSAGQFDWDVVNNYFIAGPSTSNSGDAYYQVDGNQHVYAIGNYMDGNKNGVLDGSPDNGVSGATVETNYWSTTPPLTATVNLPTLTAQNAFYTVVSNAGPVPRDQVDSQVVNNVLSLGTSGMFWTYQTSTGLGNSGYGVITGGNALPDADGSGMPDDWKAALGLSLTNPLISGSTSSTGYTYLENYLAWKALPNAFVAKNTAANPSSVVIDLSQYAAGFGTTGATYTLSNVIGGVATQTGTAPWLVTYVPTVNTSGLGGFNWTVSNSVTSMSSTCGILISQSGPSQYVRWKGNGTTNNWDTTTQNWTVINTGSATTFGGADPVTFDDSGSTSPAINLVTAVSPGGVEIAGSASNYVLSGTGVMGGNGGIEKDSLGTFTINTTQANTLAGATSVNSGTLVLDQGLGTGPIILGNGTTLDFNVSIAGNTLDVSGSATVVGKSTSALGVISGGGVFQWGTQGGYTRIDLYSNMTAFTGTMLMGTSGVNLRFDGAYGSAAGAFDLGSNGSGFYPRNGNNATFSLGSLTSDSANAYLGGASDAVTMYWSIGALNTNTTYPGVIDGTGMSIIKVGTGTFTITGTNTNYVGTTQVNAGTLVVTAPQGNSNITVNTGGTLVTNAVLSGTVTMNAGSSLYLGSSTASGNVGVLTSGSAFNINGGTTGANLYYDLSNSATATGSNDEIITSGNIGASGIINFEINLTNGTLGPGPYTLIGGGSISVSGLTLNTNIPPTNRQNIYAYRPASGSSPGYIDLSVTGNAGNLTWSGSNGATWDLNTTSTDWTGASPSTFYNLDSVTFNDTDTNGNVILSGTLQPSTIYVNNNVTNYTLSGTGGGIGGNGKLIKTGSGSLQIYPAYDTGDWAIYLEGGTLYAGAWLGNGTIYLDGGTLTVENGTYLGQSIVAETSGTINSVGGSNWITNNPGASLTSTGPVTLYVVVANGSALTIPGAMDGFQGTFEMGTSGGLVRFNGDGSYQALFDIGSSTGWFANRNGGTTVNFGALEGGPNTTLGGRQAGSGATQSNYIVGALGLNTTFAGTINNGGDLGGLNIDKVGTGNWTLSGTSNFSGNVEIEAGTLTISGSFNNAGLDFETQSGATLSLLGGTINTEVVQIDKGAFFNGYGTIDASLVNQGTTTLTNGLLTVNGDFENDGTLTVDGSATMVVNLPTDGSGSFINNGTLDIMDSPLTVLPAGYVNNGVILTSSLVTVMQAVKTGSNFSVTIQSYTGHTYQLQKSASLTAPSWQNVGAAQVGSTGTALVLTDTTATGGSMFYHIAVGP